MCNAKGLSLDDKAASTLCLANSSCEMFDGIDVRGCRSGNRAFRGFVSFRRLLAGTFLVEAGVTMGVLDLIGDNCEESVDAGDDFPEGLSTFIRSSTSMLISGVSSDVLDDSPEFFDGVLANLREGDSDVLSETSIAAAVACSCIESFARVADFSSFSAKAPSPYHRLIP